MLCSKFVFLLPNPVSTDTPTEELLPPVLWCNRAKVKVTLVTAEINAGRKGKNKHTHTKKNPLEKLSRAAVSQNLPGKWKDLPRWLALCSHTPEHSAVCF